MKASVSYCHCGRFPMSEKSPKGERERLGNIEVTRVHGNAMCALGARMLCVYRVLARYCHSRVVRARTNAKGAYAKGRRFLWYPDIRESSSQASLKLLGSIFNPARVPKPPLTAANYESRCRMRKKIYFTFSFNRYDKWCEDDAKIWFQTCNLIYLELRRTLLHDTWISWLPMRPM